MKLYNILKEFAVHGRYPFHMPGHKRSSDFDYLSGIPAEIDFTEIDGLDNLHAPEGILLEAQTYAAGVYKADRSFFLVNGSTGGILSAVYAASRGKRDIIIQRSCHKSVFNALSLCNLRASYIMPRISPEGIFLDITPDQVRSAIEKNPSACAVVITSPSYDGVVSDIASIAEICHTHGIPLIVDAAHGAHLGFLDPSVRSPVECGADITVMSLHKTLPSLTQTAILHLKSNLIPAEEIGMAATIFETSSPSYIFMASIDGCIHELGNSKMFDAWNNRIEKIRTAAASCTNVHLIRPNGVFAFDESKLLFSADNYSGDELADILRHSFGIEPEMVSENYVLLMTGAGDSDEGTDALCHALVSIPKKDVPRKMKSPSITSLPAQAMTAAEAGVKPKVQLPLEAALGRISCDTLMCYPPGIPLIVPGEIISGEIIEKILSLSADGMNILNAHGIFDGTISAAAE